jgi:hypothetical protein
MNECKVLLNGSVGGMKLKGKEYKKTIWFYGLGEK